MKKVLAKISGFCKKVFGYGIYVSLFVGGFTFFGYVVAFILGGEAAAKICEFMTKYIIPFAIYLANCMVVLGVFSMYLAGELALTPSKRKK